MSEISQEQILKAKIESLQKDLKKAKAEATALTEQVKVFKAALGNLVGSLGSAGKAAADKHLQEAKDLLIAWTKR